MSLGELKVTAGRSGERNILIEKFWVQVGNAFPCGFNVKTLAGNNLEVTLEQLSYKKPHYGTGKLTTTIIPVVPIGTKGRVIVHDTTTGEIAEQPWTWHLLGGGGIGSFGGIWSFIKRLLWK